jgi:hypothetical protein
LAEAASTTGSAVGIVRGRLAGTAGAPEDEDGTTAFKGFSRAASFVFVAVGTADDALPGAARTAVRCCLDEALEVYKNNQGQADLGTYRRGC